MRINEKKTTITEWKDKNYVTIVEQAKSIVIGFREAFCKFIERVTIDQNSKSLISSYGRNIASIALHFNRVPHLISTDEINSYLYRLTTHENLSLSYFKQTVFGLRYWFRTFGLEENALLLPSIKKTLSLPVVMSKEECKELFKASRSFKHRFLLAFAYSAGLRMNELRMIRISDIDLDRKQIHVRMGKGKKDRYVILSKLIATKFNTYLAEVKPQVYLFEGLTPGHPMGERSIQYVINEALKKTSIKKDVSMHTLRHSYATHLLEDGVDLHSIQRLLGHSDIRTTLVYLHIAQVKNKLAHSPLDTLYNIK
jgi:integrase/recombinase XerD